MNKNELFEKFSVPVREANYHFQEKYYFTRSLWFATGCALGILAVKGVDSWREHRSEQFDQEIEQFFTDNPPERDVSERDAA